MQNGLRHHCCSSKKTNWFVRDNIFVWVFIEDPESIGSCTMSMADTLPVNLTSRSYMHVLFILSCTKREWHFGFQRVLTYIFLKKKTYLSFVQIKMHNLIVIYKKITLFWLNSTPFCEIKLLIILIKFILFY